MGVANMFARPGWSEFFAAVATDERTRHLVHVSRLDVGPVWSAINLGLVFRDTYCHVLASYDDGETSRFGAGAAHLRELLRYSIERGLKHFDFTIGDERYKREWSDRTLLLYDHVAAASVRGWAAAAMVHGHRRVKRFIKQNEKLWSLFSRARAALGPKSAAPAAEEGCPHRLSASRRRSRRNNRRGTSPGFETGIQFIRANGTGALKAAHRTSANHRTHDSKRCSCPYVFGGWGRSDRSPFWRLGADHPLIARSSRKTLAFGNCGPPCSHTPVRRTVSF